MLLEYQAYADAHTALLFGTFPKLAYHFAVVVGLAWPSRYCVSAQLPVLVSQSEPDC
jgi:hypothetical protein